MTTVSFASNPVKLTVAPRVVTGDTKLVTVRTLAAVPLKTLIVEPPLPKAIVGTVALEAVAPP